MKEKMKTSKHGQWDIEKEEVEFKPEDGLQPPKVNYIKPKRVPLPPGSNIKPLNIKRSPSEELVQKMDHLKTELKDLKKREDGQVHHYKMGHTKSGKTIMSTDKSPYGKDFNAADHRDAYFMHGNKAKHLKEAHHNDIYGDLIAHHEGMAQSHWRSYQDMLTQRPKAVDAHGLKKSLAEEGLFETLSKSELHDHFRTIDEGLIDCIEEYKTALASEVIRRNREV